jgi:endonuclease III
MPRRGGLGPPPQAARTAGSSPRAGTAGLEPALRREWRAPFGVDVRLTLSVHRHGGGDPAYRLDAAGAVWRTSLTPDGPGTLRLTSQPAPAGTLVTGQAWGPGAAWLLDTLPAQLGARDDLSGFTVRHPVVGELVLRYQGMRIGRTSRVFEALVPAVLEQKVTGREAHRAWRFLLGKYGAAAPGPAPAGMRVIPPPSTWACIPSWDWHRAGVEGVRARTIISAAAVAARLEEASDLDPAEADRRLRSLPGIGPWTSAEIRQRAAGDADAVSVGDYHLPKAVGWTLAGRITDDAGMLELLAPYAGHRYRVARLIELGGRLPPRRGPRMPVRDYRAF